MDSLALHPIPTLRDPSLPDWLDLFQDAFPLTEQVRFSAILRTLQEIEAGSSASHLLRLEVDGRFAGLVWWERASDMVAFLWYFAVSQPLRGAGLGSRAYRLLVDELRREGLRILVFEIEHPDDPHADPALALRRRGFYQRCGARCAQNVPYTQSVGWQPAVRMWLMAHPLAGDVTEGELADALWEVFSQSAERVDTVQWWCAEPP